MKKFLVILLISLLSVQQSFAAIQFDNSYNQKISATQDSVDVTAVNLIRHTVIGAWALVTLGMITGKVKLSTGFKWLIALFFVGSTATFVTQNIASADSSDVSNNFGSYFERSRDTSRMSGLNNIALAINMYYLDHDKYPKPLASGCIPTEELKKYLKTIPTDPVAGRLTQGCNDKNALSTYAYALTKNEKGEQIMLLGADMEVRTAGNSFLAIFAYAETPNLIKSWKERKMQWQHYIIVQ